MPLSFRAESRTPVGLLSANISGSFDFAPLRSDRHSERLRLLASPYFQLFSQNPMQRDKQYENRHDEYGRVESEHAKCDSKIAFLQTEEHVWLATPPVIVLLHFGS